MVGSFDEVVTGLSRFFAPRMSHVNVPEVEEELKEVAGPNAGADRCARYTCHFCGECGNIAQVCKKNTNIRRIASGQGELPRQLERLPELNM